MLLNIVKSFMIFEFLLIKVFANDCFRAAVFEHVKQGVLNNQTDGIDKNLKIYEYVAKTAAEQKAQIIVFPEDGIFGTGKKRTDIQSILEKIPNPNDGKIHNPCNEPEKYSKSPMLYRLSCAAKNNKIYIAADMGDIINCSKTDPTCPDDGYFQYNTEVLFDSNGTLIAKYHKMQLYGEYYYNVPKKPEFVYADTPFGRLGLFICFDMMFKSPGINLIEEYNVTTMLYTTWWFDLLPMLSAAQNQQAWSITNQVNVLASNCHIPKRGTVGSGIYTGRNGQVVYNNTPDGIPKLLIANIPVNAKLNNKCEADSKIINIDLSKILSKPKLLTKDEIKYNYQNMNIEKSSHFLLTKEKNQVTKCANNFCCHLDYSLKNNSKLKNEKYYLILAKRNHEPTFPEVVNVFCEEFCALVKCKSDKNNTCHEFSNKAEKVLFDSVKLNANFTSKYIYPSAITNNLKLINRDKWKFSIKKTLTNNSNNNNNNYESQISVDTLDDPLLTLALYGRCYQNDAPYKQTKVFIF